MWIYVTIDTSVRQSNVWEVSKVLIHIKAWQIAIFINLTKIFFNLMNKLNELNETYNNI